MRTEITPVDWDEARALMYEAGLAAAGTAESMPLSAADGCTLAEPLVPLSELPAFWTSGVDGWAVRGPGPWRPVGRVLAGDTPPPLTEPGTCVEIATGAMIPSGVEALVRIEESARGADGRVDGTLRPEPEWRLPGDEAHRGEQLFPAGTPVDAAVLGMAATCGHDLISVRPQPSAAVLVFGDELLTSGPAGGGRVRDSLSLLVPPWLRRYGATVDSLAVRGPVQDTLAAHVEAIEGVSRSPTSCARAAGRGSALSTICTRPSMRSAPSIS